MSVEHRTYKGVDYCVAGFESTFYDSRGWIAACDGHAEAFEASERDVVIGMIENNIDGMIALGRIKP